MQARFVLRQDPDAAVWYLAGRRHAGCEPRIGEDEYWTVPCTALKAGQVTAQGRRVATPVQGAQPRLAAKHARRVAESRHAARQEEPQRNADGDERGG